MKPLKGKFSITMPSSSHRRDRYVQLTISDENSGTQFLEVEIAANVWTDATAGSMGYCDCEFRLRRAGDVGKMREIKSELVRVEEGSYQDGDRLAAEAIAPYEVDGWKGHLNDAQNHHRVVEWGDGFNVYKVGFSRLVDVEQAED